ncbi:helix-turn-helix domain-containing protein [Pseudoduganella lurida]|jgi:AraC family transcriptional activator of mtrCDE|uniref:helix-turn-helix domain-containing protein n=1 Tax=Pseudoduganella lurida TaxID=1036180 RepID=UPI00119E090B
MLATPDRPWKGVGLAVSCNMSRATFTRIFQQVTNTTSGEVLTQIRMVTAAKLVSESRMSVGLIAEKIGYQYEAFNRVFKRHYSTWPRCISVRGQGPICTYITLRGLKFWM